MSEMPGLYSSRWRGTEHDVPLLEMITAGQPLPADAPWQVVVLADRLTQLAKPDGPGELAGEVAAISAFRRPCSPASTMPLIRPRRHRRRRPRLTAGHARLAAVLAIATFAVGGSAAAYADLLPGSLQDIAHRLIDAPPALHHAAHPPASNQAPDLHHGGGASSRSAANRKHQQVSHGIAKGHGKRTGRPHPVGKASKHKHRRRAQRTHRHVPRISPSPSPTPTLTPIR